MTVSAKGSLTRQLDSYFASDPAIVADPFPLFRELRELAAAVRFGGGVVVTTYAEVSPLLADTGSRFSKQRVMESPRFEARKAGLTPEQQRVEDDVSRFILLEMTNLDGAEHERLRTIAHRSFTPRRIQMFEERIERYTNDLLAPLARDGTIDLMDFAYRLPLLVILDLLGVPEEDGQAIHGWSTMLAARLVDNDTMVAAQVAVGEFRAYVDRVIEEHRTSRAYNDLVATLMDAEEEGRMTGEEIAAHFVLMLHAGHETSTNLIGLGVLELMRHREQWDLLAGNPELAPAATEELLRWISPAQYVVRMAAQDLEIDGVPVPEGEMVYPLIASANRDPAVFEQPETLDLTRKDSKQHLALGYGPRFCLGASLARLEAQIAFRALAERFPELELATDTFEWKRQAASIRGVKALPVKSGGRD